QSLLDDIDRFEAIIVRVASIDAELIERATSLRVVSKHGVGLDNIDIDTASAHGVVVCNTPGANSRAVAEHALTLLLTVRKGVSRADRDVRNGEWARSRYIAPEVGGTTFGLFGVGDIGSLVSEFGRGLGMDMVGYDPYVPAEAFPDGVEKVADKEAFFDRVDHVTVHTPLTPETEGAVGRDELAAIGPDGIVVNTARGGIVDEEALLAALESGDIGGAGLDVRVDEPPAPEDPLLERDDVVFSPHVAGASADALREMSRRAAANVRTVFDGGLPETTVNADDLAD
ncbi:MAG: hydroxyacid dehydrogenase, partial [Halobacteriales archaeon]|nr:hydroxyacid dehydrogenase [Halobacteriales archaeon]